MFADLLKDLFNGYVIKDIREKNKEVEERINALKATIDGEDEWFLEKIEKKKGSVKFVCKCREKEEEDG